MARGVTEIDTCFVAKRAADEHILFLSLRGRFRSLHRATFVPVSGHVSRDSSRNVEFSASRCGRVTEACENYRALKSDVRHLDISPGA